MKRLYIYILLTTATAAIAGCDRTKQIEAVPMSIERIDLYVGNYASPGSPNDTLQPGLGLYIELMGLGNTERDSALTVLHEHPVSRIFGRDIKSRFSQADSLALPLGNTVKRLTASLPDVNVSHIYGIASPYMQGVIVSDSVVMVALNHYLGSDYDGYSAMPAYSRQFKTAERIPTDVAEALIRVNYPYQPTDGTLLERLLYEGAVIRAAMLADGDDTAAALGLDDEEYRLTGKSTRELWGALASERLLYSTSPDDIARLTEPAPFTRIGSMKLPGRACRLIGLEIIDNFMTNNPDATISDLLSPDFYGQSQNRLIASRYNP